MPLTPRQIHSALRRTERMLRAWRGLVFLIAGLALAGTLLGGLVLLDAEFRFGAMGRWAAFAVFLLPLGWAAWRGLGALCRRMDESAIARRLEVAEGREDNSLVNAVQLDRDLPEASPWREAVFGELSGQLGRVDWGKAFDRRRMTRWAAALGTVALIALVCYAVRPDEFRLRVARVLQPSREIAPLTRTRILGLLPGDKTVARGTALAVEAEVGGEIPGEAWLVVRGEDGKEEKLAMSRNDDGTRWQAARKWEKSARYTVVAGDARSFTRRIDVKLPARPVKQDLRITPPPYTRLGDIGVPEGQPWPAILAGSNVSLTWTFDRDLTRLEGKDTTGAAVKAASTGPMTWMLSGPLVKARDWKMQWTDSEGLEDHRKVEFALKLDEAPKIHLIEPSGDGEVMLSAGSWLRVVFEAVDDFGLARAGVFRSSADKLDAQAVELWTPNARSLKQAVMIPVQKFVAAGETEAVFCVVAQDGNNVTGPGVGYSRPIVVRIVSEAEMQRARDTTEGKWQASLEDLVQMQRTNLEATRQSIKGLAGDPEVAALVERQARVEIMAREILAGAAGEEAEWRQALESVASKEMPAAVVALRDAAASKGQRRGEELKKGEALETAILARLQSMPGAVKDEAAQRKIRDLIASVEQLFQREKDLHGRTLKAEAAAAPSLAREQDALADESRRVRKAIEEGALNSSLGDAGFRAVLAKAGAEFGQAHIYEDMIRAAEQLEGKKFPEAAGVEKQVLVSLARILELLNTWQIKEAGDKAEAQQEAAEKMEEQLGELVDKQKAIVEKSKELAAKDQFRPEDVAVAKEMGKTKEEMAEMIEQMLKDAHIFPELHPMNELREELTKIYEDVIQQDKELAQQGKLTPQQIAVQKEESMLEALEKAKETVEDMEMWLPNKNETQEWVMENFDQTEMPEIPNVPLADSFTDLVGDLLEEQEDLAQQVEDAASNQAFAVNPANGWEVRDGPMPGFNAQGRSGNERPNKNEQTGRSSGGREGMSNGEMVNQRADRLEGRTPDARRTNDPMQQGQVADDGAPSDAKATGGGKAGGASQREGMTGEAPIRPVQAPNQTVNEALAVEQALLSQQTARSYATARLFYLRTGPMPEVAQLMDESRDALKSGRLEDFQALHKRIVAKLQDLQSKPGSEEVRTLAGSGTATTTEKRLPGGEDVKIPEGYHDDVADYFRSLDTP